MFSLGQTLFILWLTDLWDLPEQMSAKKKILIKKKLQGEIVQCQPNKQEILWGENGDICIAYAFLFLTSGLIFCEMNSS